MTTETPAQPDSLLPYDRWTEAALRSVLVDALDYVARDGLPGEHHFYITFRTDFPGVTIPGHLKARFPQEMTIVLQHQFWDLRVDHATRVFSVGLSFGGVASTLVIPLAAVTGFVDPHVQFGLRFQPDDPAADAAAPEPEAAKPPAPDAPEEPQQGQVLRLDAFRRKAPPKE